MCIIVSNLICFPFSCKEGGAVVVFLSDLIIIHFEILGNILSRFSKPHWRRTVIMVVTLLLSEHRNARSFLARALDRCRCWASLVHRNSMLISSGNRWWLGRFLGLICICWTYPECDFLSTLVLLQLLFFIALVQISISECKRIVLGAFTLRGPCFQDPLGEVLVRRWTSQPICSLRL